MIKQRAVFFDLDGTLIDSVPDVHLCLCKALGIRSSQALTVRHVREFVGQGARPLVKEAIKLLYGEDELERLDQLVSLFISEYRLNPVRLTTLYPGACELLNYLKGKGIRLAICTNKPHATTEPVLKRLNLIDYFDEILCGDQVSHPKPDGRHITSIMENMSLTRDSIIMVGDSRNDLEASHDAGVRSIAVSYGYESDLFEHPLVDIKVNTLSEICEKLEEVWDIE